MSRPIAIPALRPSRPRLTKNALLNRPDRRKDSGTAATNFRGRAKARRVRLRKLQRQARRRQS
jgi:hypothetical protein